MIRLLRWLLLSLALFSGAALANPAPILSPDALIGKVLQNIRASRLDDALKEVDRLIALRPDFRLAHLIRGDLLMARAHPLSGMGNTGGNRRHLNNLDDLREEARARLNHLIAQPDRDLLPREILQLGPHQRYALLADAAMARLYLFENVAGEPRLIRDFYMTIGRNGMDKRVEGDRRTPIGVYRIIESLPGERLPDLYGAGAFPLNYPNAWDRVQRRGGHGIWLHGVPSDTYSRPPRSSDGCVVVSNPDLDELHRFIQVGITPVVIADRADWVDRATWERERDQLLATLERWRLDWEARDPEVFMQHYVEEFVQGRGRAWAERKRRNIDNKDWIRVEIHNPSLFIYPGGDMAYVEFTQVYASDSHNSTTEKQLYLQRQGESWRITLEISSAATRLAGAVSEPGAQPTTRRP